MADLLHQIPRLAAYTADAYRRTLFVAGSAGLAAMMGVVVMQIFCRYLLGFSLIWAEEFSRAVLVWITFLFAGLALERGEMVAVDTLVLALPRPARIAALVVGGGAALWIILELVRLGYAYAVFNSGQVLAALQISQFWIYLALPVGMGLFGLHLLVRLIAQIGEAMRGDPLGGHER